MGKNQPDNEYAQYIPERRTVQILEILKKISDEQHAVRQSDILTAMKETGAATTENAGTLSKSIDEILLQINPDAYSPEKDSMYRIKYRGYEKDLIARKQDIKEGLLSAKKAPAITDLYYVHDLSFQELDQIIQAVSYSSAIAPDEKSELIGKLVHISSDYYNTPYYNREKEKITFHTKGIYNRIQSTDADASARISNNLHIIQEALNKACQIRFMFNAYDENGELQERYSHILSPYYIVVYHDMYYLVGGKTGGKLASHFRIDLMTNVEMVVDDEGKYVPIEAMSHFKNLPKREKWNPETYMAEHLYMAYDEPRNIKIRIRRDQYTMIHDWFGTHYRKCQSDRESGYNVVEVVSSPNMIVHWAMQYAGTVEILDEDIREKIRDEIGKMKEKYETI